jgi:hypothetical protein
MVSPQNMSLVLIRGFIKDTNRFPIQKCAIFCKFKEIKELRGGILLYAAQAIPLIDAEIAGKGHLWTETSYKYDFNRKTETSKKAMIIFFPALVLEWCLKSKKITTITMPMRRKIQRNSSRYRLRKR